MWEVENQFKVRLGGNTYIDCPDLIRFRMMPVFTLRRHDETGYLGIDFYIYDAARKLIATVKRNEIYEGNKDAYRIDGSLDGYTLTEKATGKVICDIKKRGTPGESELDVSAELYMPDGQLFSFTPTKTVIGPFIGGGNTLRGPGAGIIFN